MISVVIAAYNAVGFISRAIASVQAQTFQDWEIIVADDASSDATREVVTALIDKDPRIRMIEAGRNAGPSAARNRAFDAARGDWFAILDADDAWEPSRLATLLKLAAAYDCDLVADNLVFHDDYLARPVGLALPEIDDVRTFDVCDVLASERPWPRFRLGFLKPMIRAEFIRSHELRYRESYRYAEDFLFLCEVLLCGGRAAMTGKPLYIYTVQMNTLSGRKSTTSRSPYDPDQRFKIAGELQARYGASATPAQRRSLERYQGWMRDIRDGYLAVNAVRAGTRGATARLLATRPRALGVYMLTTPTWKRLVQASTNVWRGRLPSAQLRQRIM